jgi:hypothetical protein
LLVDFLSILTKEPEFGKIMKELAEEQAKRSQDSYDPLEFLIGWACQKGSSTLVKLLLAAKRIDPSARKQSPIRFTCSVGLPTLSNSCWLTSESIRHPTSITRFVWLVGMVILKL